jgi:hypothetical protein
MAEAKKKATGYDKYVDWKLFFIPVVLFFLILVLPTPYGMKDVDGGPFQGSVSEARPEMVQKIQDPGGFGEFEKLPRLC